MDHAAEDAHHGDTIVTGLGGTFEKLDILIQVVPVKVNLAVVEVPTNLLWIPYALSLRCRDERRRGQEIGGDRTHNHHSK